MILALTLSLSMCACNNKDNNNTSDDKASSSEVNSNDESVSINTSDAEETIALSLPELPDTGTVCLKITCYYPDDRIQYWDEYIYDDSSEVIAINNYNSDGILRRMIDNVSNSITDYNPDGSVSAVNYINPLFDPNKECIVDADGNITEMTKYNEDGSVSLKEYFEYDENDLWIKTYKYDENGNQISCKYEEFDANGNRTFSGGIESYENKENGTYYEYEYNVYGSLTRQTAYFKGKLTDEWIFEYNEYNEFGQPIKYTEFDDEGNITRYDIYEYGEL